MRLGLFMRRMALDWTLSRRQTVDLGAPPQTWDQYSRGRMVDGDQCHVPSLTDFVACQALSLHVHGRLAWVFPWPDNLSTSELI